MVLCLMHVEGFCVFITLWKYHSILQEHDVGSEVAGV